MDGGQSVTGSVVLGDVVQIRDVGGNVSVTLSRPVYRVEGFPAARFAVTVEQARAQPSRLLLARYELVPFAGRADLLVELSGWLREAGPASVRLIYGPGGQGKSRLAAQFARHHPAEWTVWQARQSSSASQSPAHIEMPVGAAGLLVVADYADRWAPSHLQALIADVYALARRLPGPLPLRVLLLARTAGFWWEALEQRLDADHGIPATAAVLPPLGGEVDRAELFAVACEPFRSRDGHDRCQQGGICADAAQRTRRARVRSSAHRPYGRPGGRSTPTGTVRRLQPTPPAFRRIC